MTLYLIFLNGFDLGIYKSKVKFSKSFSYRSFNAKLCLFFILIFIYLFVCFYYIDLEALGSFHAPNLSLG